MKPFYFATRKLQLVPAVTILVALALSIPNVRANGYYL